MQLRVVIALATLALAGCAARYHLVPAEETFVGGKDLVVTPAAAWNMVPVMYDQTSWEETWTRNGLLLESITFVGGLPDGKALRKQRRKSDQQVPRFRADMTPQDLVSMVESAYRTRGVTVFDIESVEPADFLGGKGLNVRFKYAPNDGLAKQGSCTLRVVDQKLYLILLEGVTRHYFDAALPEFEKIVASARLER
jgi:hypothetical protein